MPSDISMMYDMYYNHLQSPFKRNKDRIERMVTDAFEGTNVKVIEILPGSSLESFIVKFGFLGFTFNVEEPIEYLCYMVKNDESEVICRDHYMDKIMWFLREELLKG